VEWILTTALLGYAIGVVACLRFRLRLGIRSFMVGLVIAFLSLMALAGWVVPPNLIAIPIFLWFVGLFLQGVALGTRLTRTAMGDSSLP
jgi:hypothetical protein